MNYWATEVLQSYGFKFAYPMTEPMYPVIAVLFYVFTVFYFSPEAHPKSARTKAKAKAVGLTPTKLFIFTHNLILCIFSWVVFINVFPEIYGKLRMPAADSTDTLYDNWRLFACSPMSSNELYWSHLFYLSKIWEFIDTWIILWKKRKPSTLQVYHHIGAVFACWLQVIVAGNTFWVFVCLNSFIHTIMYAYYCCTTLGYRFKFKFVITILQLSQFVFGQTLGLYQYFNFSECYRSTDFWVWIINSVYVWPLVALFAHFFRQTYLKNKQKKS